MSYGDDLWAEHNRTLPAKLEERRLEAMTAALDATEKALEDSRRRVAERLRRGIPPGDALHDHDTPIVTDAEQRRRDREGT